MNQPIIHSSVFVAPGAFVTGDVVIGENSSVWYNAVLRGDMAQITIGKNTNVQDGCILHTDPGSPLRLGDYVTVGHGAILHGCTVQEGSLVGMGAIVLDGAVIGRNCLVGAGALVTRRTAVPDGSLVLGNPAKIKRSLSAKELENLRDNAYEYIALSQKMLKANA